MHHFKQNLDHQMDVTKKILGLVPEGKEDYVPAEGFMPLGQLLTHLAESPLFMKAIILNQFPSQVEMQAMMENRPKLKPSEAISLLDKHYGELKETLKSLSPEHYDNGIVHTPFMGDAPCWVVLGATIEHLINHRHQLFMYMKLMGLPVDTGTLYFGMLKAQAGA